MARSIILYDLKDKEVDVLVIGGGITGAGIALDAASRGLSTALVDMQDFAAGTSSRSTKLVHGGLRYLKQFEVKMVSEVGKERAIVYENGPHVTTPEWMLLPIYKGGTFGKYTTSMGLRVYDFLAGVKKSERRKMLDASTTLEKEPLLKKEGLKGSGYYVEYRTDDARLTIEVIKKAVEFGARAVNYTKAVDFLFENKKINGVKVVDQLTGKAFNLYAKKIVNATGPWVDFVRRYDLSRNGKTLKLTKGVHIVIDQKRFPLKQAIYYDTPDNRMVFAIPRDGKTYVGTTDTFYEDDLANPLITNSDRDYLLQTINHMFPTIQITSEDIESSWSGLRPLIHEEGKHPSEISRKDEIWVSDSGLITIAGGKLTGYRKMAETVVDLIGSSLKKEIGKKIPSCRTKRIAISGGDIHDLDRFIEEQVSHAQKFGLTKEEVRILAKQYGTNLEKVFSILEENSHLNKYQLPKNLFGALIYCIEHEMVVKPSDFFIRRTGALYFNLNQVEQSKEKVLNFMSNYYKWSLKETELNKKELEQQLKNAKTSY
ncbi:glycerol-3-phosphate dehydrogenase/oxidase [Bacillus luteolus]|uniref:Glycerol-3-phosphate dehydrogenase n=2 Tax=Litchfieldia luteola TaxID=682179 RepID=A0ABR9QKJ2_9BACI|nr:glycerol-3-phosphate dehydrogenase/oxidase [Cytobacillus luteolus]MBE4909002.1 glycerol-3-phosphate dehydrogenase/oxidase [Cytobacillus luteolus]